MTTKMTPVAVASVLFDVRYAPKVTESEAKWFHTHTQFEPERLEQLERCVEDNEKPSKAE
jgi:hypothetical protein